MNTTHPRTSLDTAGARALASVTKSRPQMQGITPRWLLRVLPWVEVRGGVFRLNRREALPPSGNPVVFTEVGGRFQVVPASLAQLPELAGYTGLDDLRDLAGLFAQHTLAPGALMAQAAAPADRIWLVAEGRLAVESADAYDAPTTRSVLAEGDALRVDADAWPHTVRALTPVTALACDRATLRARIQASPSLRAHAADVAARRAAPHDRYGQRLAPIMAGHHGEPTLPAGSIHYDRTPPELPLQVCQTILRVHTRVTDLYNGQINQLEEQLRLTIEALRERQEAQMLLDPAFGLIPTVHPEHRLHAAAPASLTDDLDALLCRRPQTSFFMAHPQTIAAIGRACSRQGLVPETLTLEGRAVQTWRRVPLLPSNKIPIIDGRSVVLAARAGVDNQGVIALHQTGLPGEVQPSLNVRFMGIDERSVTSYLVSAYYGVVAQVPNATGLLDGVQVHA